MPGAGLVVHCAVRDGRIGEVVVTPRRIPPIERLAIGHTPAQTPGLFAGLLALCPDAHGLAAANALAAATGVQPSALLQCRRETRVALEIIKEHCLNLLAQQPAPALAPGLLNTHRALRAALGGARLYGAEAGSADVDETALHAGLTALEGGLQTLCGKFWRMDEPELADVERWHSEPDSPAACLLQRWTQAGWAAFGRCRMNLLPPLPAEYLHDWLAGAQAELAAPTWQGEARETGAYARQAAVPLIRAADSRYGNGLYTRLLARLVEIKALFQQVRRRMCDDVAPAARLQCAQAHGIGLAQVEASRGRLLHGVVLAENRVQSYRMLAPTEWNFHPRGLLRAALLGVPVTADLPERIDALLRAIDPCVDFHITLNHE